MLNALLLSVMDKKRAMKSFETKINYGVEKGSKPVFSDNLKKYFISISHINNNAYCNVVNTFSQYRFVVFLMV